MAVYTYKCPSCQAPLAFEPDTQRFSCDYCGASYLQSELNSMDAARPAEQGESQWDGQVLYLCPGCGAEIVTDETTAATTCHYCHNPVILSGRLGGGFKPDLVVPFKIDREEAEQRFVAWKKKKRFAPRAFIEAEPAGELFGVYYPYWMVSCQAFGSLSGRATRVRTWLAGGYSYTETSFYQISRAGDLRFEELLKDALKKTDRLLAEGVLPYELSDAKPFSPTFLSGFQAEKRDIERAELAADVKREIEGYAASMLRQSVSGYATVTADQNEVQITAEDWKYLLTPAWVATYKHRDKTYYYAMNGQTGKVCGVLPVDRGRLFSLFAAVSASVFVLLMIAGFFL